MNKKLPNHSIKSVMDALFCCKEKQLMHPPKVLILYGSLREHSYSRFVAEESGRILTSFGCEVKLFNPKDLPVANIELTQTKDVEKLPKSVHELRELVIWSEAMVWSTPEVHGAMSSVLKNQIDWLPLVIDSVRPTQGKLLALTQVSGGSQTFNALNQMRVLGRWMRMFTIPNQSSIPKAYEQFNKKGELLESTYKQRLVDVMEELFKFTLLLRGNMDYLVNRHSEDLQNYDKNKLDPKNTVSFHGKFDSLKIARESGVSASKLKAQGYDIKDLLAAGFSKDEIEQK